MDKLFTTLILIFSTFIIINNSYKLVYKSISVTGELNKVTKASYRREINQKELINHE